MKRKSTKKQNTLTAREFDEKFDRGEDISPYIDWDSASKNVGNLELPLWQIELLDREATRRGSTRIGLIRHWIVEKLDQIEDKHRKSVV